MPTLGAPLDFVKLEGRNFRAHLLGGAPSSPVTGQLYYNTGDNTLYWWDGTGWISARGGASATPQATPSTQGTIQLAGDLTGTAVSPQIAASAVTDAEVAAANKDGAAGTVGMRSLGSGASQAMPGNRTLDQITAPAANVGFNNKAITALADPSSDTDGANKRYVDNTAQGLDAKASVRVASTGNLNLAAPGAAIDGITLNAGSDRVLVKDQSTQSQNGIYLFNGPAAAMTRTTDANSWTEHVSAFVFVEDGTTNTDTGWVCTVNQGGILDTTSITWTQFSGAGQVVAGTGLAKTGNTLDVGAGAGIQVNTDTVQVANNGITNAMLADGAVDLASADVTGTLPLTKGGLGVTTAKSAREAVLGTVGAYVTQIHGAGTTISIPQSTHTLRSSRNMIVQVQDAATGVVELPDVAVTSGGDVTISFGAAVVANSKLITILG